MANTGNGIVFLILAFLLLLFVDFQSHYQLWGKKPSTNSEDHLGFFIICIDRVVLRWTIIHYAHC